MSFNENEFSEDGAVTSHVIDLNDENFNPFVRGSRYAAVIFWSGSCMPCRMMLLVFDELSKVRRDVSFGRVNVGTSSVAGSMGVLSVPTVLLFRKGKRVARIVGVKPLRLLEEIVSNHLSEDPKPDIYSESGGD
ncbi:MAG: thioredoxin domain-containing protein [Candidatus Verstraetearchaeota archaeon]|nr:thioredoxin domain-containing protein [Candidatus Verstraetearchaeota archaeon]